MIILILNLTNDVEKIRDQIFEIMMTKSDQNKLYV